MDTNQSASPVEVPADDRSALVRLLGEHRATLRRWAHRRLPVWARTISDTSDLVQDALLRTLERLDVLTLHQPHALRGYLRQAVVNKIADEHRRIARRGATVALEDENPSSLPSPFDEAVAGELQARYKAALHEFTDRDRMLLAGHIEMGYTIDQLACMSGKTIAATRMALRRALVRLAGKMTPEEK